VLAQRSQLQQFAAASISRKCVSSSPSQLTDDLYHHQLHQSQYQHQQQYLVESAAGCVSQSVCTSSSSWQAAAGRLPHCLQSATTTSPAHLLYSTSVPVVAPELAAASLPAAVTQSAGSYNSSTTDSHSNVSQHQSVDDDDRRVLSTVHQRIKEFTTAYTTQTTTSF